MAVPVSPFVGLKGIEGPLYSVDPSNNNIELDETTGLPVGMYKSNGDARIGFYRVEIKDRDELGKRVRIEVTAYFSKRKFIRNPNSGFKITYNISNLDQILDETGNITTLGTYDTWFERTVVRANNTCETDKARDFILSLTGALSDSTHVRFQDHCPINFSTMSVDNITQTNVTNALA